jgi:uncharacterized membrane protein (DUF2068 family)
MNNNHNVLERRPTGVTILASLLVLAGAITLLGGITTLVAIPFAANLDPNALNNAPLTPGQQTALIQNSGSILTVLGAVLIPLGIASLIVAYGLFKGKRWAWSIAVVLSAIGIAINVVSLVTGSMAAMAGTLVGIAINAIVLYYLSQRNVRQYFGKTNRALPSTTKGA